MIEILTEHNDEFVIGLKESDHRAMEVNPQKWVGEYLSSPTLLNIADSRWLALIWPGKKYKH